MSIWDGLNDSVLAVFGESVTYRRTGSADLAITAIPSDPLPEEAAPGQYTVYAVRAADITNGPIVGDKLVIGGTVYDIFDVRLRQTDSMARVFVSKA